MDLSSLKKVARFAESVRAKYKKNLDYMFLNAGIMMTPYEKTIDGFESQFAVNHIGHFLLVKKWMPWIRASGTRVVTVSSGAHHITNPHGIDFERVVSDHKYNEIFAYGQSKLANVLFAQELAERLEGTRATSNVVHPGLVQSELGRHVENALSPLWRLILLPISASIDLMKLSSGMGALTQLLVATADKFKGVNGKYYNPIAVEAQTSKHAKNKILQQELWQKSETYVKRF